MGDTRGKDAARGQTPSSAFRARWGLNIGPKLGLLMCGLQLASVGALSLHFQRQQLDGLRHELEGKADTYAQLVSAQVRSAVAFDDKETAREVFDAVSSDRDLLSAALFDANGRSLHAWGVPGSVASGAGGGVGARRVFELPETFLAVAPVVSLEGPRGTLVLEFSKARLARSRSEIQRAALWAAVVALGAGVGLALLIARSFARRLRSIAVVAERVAGGDLSQVPPVDTARDEVGSLAGSFSSMLGQIQRLFAEIQTRAGEEQTRLESLVSQRTAALETRNLDMRRVLDNVDQGFLTIDRQGTMSTERSAIIGRWLGLPPASGQLWEYLDQTTPGLGAQLEGGWAEVVDGCLPRELCLEQMPRRFAKDSQHFSIGYQLMLTAGGDLEGALVVLSDVTPLVQRERAEAEQREALRLFAGLSQDRAGVLEFFAEAQGLVARITEDTPNDPHLTKRMLHTLKGNAAIFGIERLSRLCHSIEDTLAESNANIADAERQKLRDAWAECQAQLSHLAGDATLEGLSIGEDDYRELLEAFDQGRSPVELRRLVEGWRLESTGVRLKRAARQALALAERLGKGPIEVTIESNELRLDPKLWSNVWAQFPHLIRNAIDHGVEDPDERAAAGKAAPSVLHLRTFLEASRFVIEVEDSGRGVDWERVRELAVARGLPTATPADLEQALFADGLSTKDSVGETSGRGVGMAAVAAAVRAQGGQIQVHSAPLGTRVRLSWPSAATTPLPKLGSGARPATKLLAPEGLRSAPRKVGEHR